MDMEMEAGEVEVDQSNEEENWPPQEPYRRPSTPHPYHSSDPNTVFLLEVIQSEESEEVSSPPLATSSSDCPEEDWEIIAIDPTRVPHYEWYPKKKDEPKKEGRHRSSSNRRNKTHATSTLHLASAIEKRKRRKKGSSSSSALLRSILKPSLSALREGSGNRNREAERRTVKGVTFQDEEEEMEDQDLVLAFNKVKLDEGNHSQ